MSRCTVYWYRGTRTVTDRRFAVARYYDISPKADRGDIFIVHNQKSSYHTPLLKAVSTSMSLTLLPSAGLPVQYLVPLDPSWCPEIRNEYCILYCAMDPTFVWTNAPFCINQKIAVSLSVKEVQMFLSSIAEERIQRELDGATWNEKALCIYFLHFIYF